MATTHVRLSFPVLIFSCAAVYASFVWQGSMGFDLWDEGFLWYGAQRVMLGEVPIRDFMAYDPGRYYWSAGLMRLWDDNGILSLRMAVAIFQALGLFVGLLLIASTLKIRNKEGILYLLISAITLVVWMFPRHKLFDISVSIFSIGILTFLVQNPTGIRYFFSGLGIGLIAVFGRNHGVYGVAGSLGTMLWLSIRRDPGSPDLGSGFCFWTAGVVAGFSPVLLMALVVPGFAASYWESVLFLFEQRATNLPLPAPWPWKVDFASKSFGDALRGVLVGLFFLATVAFGLLSILWIVRQKLKNKTVPPAFVAASFVALPYAHVAYSRADVGHLAQGIFPLLVGCLVLLALKRSVIRWPAVLALAAASLWLMTVYHPGWRCRVGAQCATIEVSSDDLMAEPRTASDIALLRKLADRYAPDGQTFIAAPFWPGAYPLLERKAPMWETYALFPRSPAFERAEIERINSATPGFALIYDLPLDGNDGLRFKNTHPLIYRHILAHFKPLIESPDPAYQIYLARGRNH